MYVGCMLPSAQRLVLLSQCLYGLSGWIGVGHTVLKQKLEILIMLAFTRWAARCSEVQAWTMPYESMLMHVKADLH